MRFYGRRFVGWLVLGPSLVLGAARCSLLNPLEHLQAGIARDGARSDADADPSAREAGATFVDDADAKADADVVEAGPGCGPAGWSACGVTIAARTEKLGSAILANGDVYFTDEATGEIYTTRCTTAACAVPTARVRGEDMPRSLAAVSDSLFWTSRSAIRRLRIITADASPPVETIDTVAGPAQIAARYPYTVWTDGSGARAWGLTGPILTLWGKPGSSPAVGGGAYFVSENEVKRCSLDATGTGCPGQIAVLPGSTGATAILWTTLFADLFHPAGVVVAVPRASGSRLVVLERVDDAGAPMVAADDPQVVRSIAASGQYLYWTNAAGELRRRSTDDPTVTTLLRGLSGDTSVDGNDTLVLIADRGANKVLTYVR